MKSKEISLNDLIEALDNFCSMWNALQYWNNFLFASLWFVCKCSLRKLRCSSLQPFFLISQADTFDSLGLHHVLLSPDHISQSFVWVSQRNMIHSSVIRFLVLDSRTKISQCSAYRAVSVCGLPQATPNASFRSVGFMVVNIENFRWGSTVGVDREAGWSCKCFLEVCSLILGCLRWFYEMSSRGSQVTEFQ